MELKPGYKQTEVGVIPEDWLICQLREVCTVLRGGSPRPIEDYLTENADGINWIKIGDVGVGAKYIDSTAERILPSGMSRSRYVKPGDFLLSNSMSFGRPYILRIDGCIHDGWLVIGNYQTSFSSEYLYYCLSSGGVLAQYLRYAAGSSVLNLNKDIVSRVHVAIPGPQEQANISKALGEVDQLIEQLEGLIYKKKNIKQAAMQELLTGKRRLPGFSGEWEGARLGELFKFRNGLNKAKEFFGKGTSIVNYMDVFNNSAIYVSTLRGRVLLTKQERQAFDVCMGDVFFTRTSETREDIGIASVVLGEVADTAFSGFLLRARPINNRLEHGFKAYCFQSEEVRTQIVSKASYTTRALTNGRILSEVKMLVPPLPEQLAIANVLADMDAELSALEEHLCKARELRQGMMQQLLTGKIRLT
jgi:type I restriction enzyme S subunit